jgi:hypothetical protein
MEYKDYDRHSGTITIPPAHIAYAVTIAYTFGSSRGLRLRTCIQPCNWNALLLLTKGNLKTRIKPRSNDSVRRIRRQNTHTVEGAELEPATRKHVVPTYLPLDYPPTYLN